MNTVQVPINQDDQETLALLVTLGVHCNKTRLYQEALREGLKVLALRHVPNVLAQRFPENHLLADAFAGGDK